MGNILGHQSKTINSKNRKKKNEEKHFAEKCKYLPAHLMRANKFLFHYCCSTIYSISTTTTLSVPDIAHIPLTLNSSAYYKFPLQSNKSKIRY